MRTLFETSGVMQVGPSLLVLGDEAREHGLKYSLLERLQLLYEKCGGDALQYMWFLNTNYRCHKDIMKIPNELFYESTIKPHTIEACVHHLAEYPLVFVCSSLTLSVNGHLEARILLDSVKHFVVVNWPKSWGKKNLTRICLVTSTRTQVILNELLLDIAILTLIIQLVNTRRMAREEFEELISARILTTYEIQGKYYACQRARLVLLSQQNPKHYIISVPPFLQRMPTYV